MCITNCTELRNRVQTVLFYQRALTQHWTFPTKIDCVTEAGYELEQKGKHMFLHTNNGWFILKSFLGGLKNHSGITRPENLSLKCYRLYSTPLKNDVSLFSMPERTHVNNVYSY